MAWWIWILVGLALLAIEMVTPGGFFAIFGGIAALLVGVLVVVGGAPSDMVQWLLFSVLSVLGVAVFRRPLRRKLKLEGTGRVVDSIAGEEAVVVEEVPPGGVGKAELRGTTWAARSASAVAVPPGRRCRVERVEGLTLWIRA
jgi:inner membrane protein